MNDGPTYQEWCDDLSKVAPSEQGRFIFESLKNKKHLHIFGRYFFPHVIKGISDVPECHMGLVAEIAKRHDSAIIFPRGFAKSTWVKIDTIHDIVYALEPVILYIGDTIAAAGFHFESIKAELENNELLRAIYGNLVPLERADGEERIRRHFQKWTAKHFETLNKVNVVARGAGKGRGVNIKNQRPTKIIIDDAENDDMVKNPVRRMKFHNWLHEVIMPSKDAKRGFIKMIGTVLAKHCEVLRFYTANGGIFRRAIENGESIWPAMWSLDLLEKQKEKMGSRSFSQEYMNNPVSEDDSVIKPSWVHERVFYELPPAKTRLQKVIMLDPQSGESAGSDYYGLVVLGCYSQDIHRYFLQVTKGKGSQLYQAALLVRTWQENLEAVFVGVEKVMTQVAVYQLILDWKAGKIDLEGVDNDNRNIPIIAVEPEGKDKVARLQKHEAAFERGEIHVHHTMRNFIDNLTAFPYVEHDDDVDAAIYCLDWSYKSGFTPVSSAINSDPGAKSIVGNVYKQKF